jgi:hypothetical protein
MERLFSILDWFLPGVERKYLDAGRILVLAYIVAIVQLPWNTASFPSIGPYYTVSTIILFALRRRILRGSAIMACVFLTGVFIVLLLHHKHSIQFPDASAFQSFRQVRVCMRS